MGLQMNGENDNDHDMNGDIEMNDDHEIHDEIHGEIHGEIHDEIHDEIHGENGNTVLMKGSDMALYMDDRMYSLHATVTEERVVSLFRPTVMSCQGSGLDGLTSLLNSRGIPLIEPIPLDLNGMELRLDTLLALDIFNLEKHPNTHGGQARQGLCLFGILNGTKTQGGKILLKQWCFTPLLDVHAIESRLDRVECFVKNAGLACELTNLLKPCKSICTIMNQFQTARHVSHFKHLMGFASSCLMIRKLILESGLVSEFFTTILETFDESILRDVLVIIQDTVDIPGSEEEKPHIKVKDSVDDDLDERKRTYAGLDNFLSTLVTRVQVPDYIPISIVYFPQLGFLISTDCSHFLDPADGFTFQFKHESTSFYKNGNMIELDETIGDIHSDIMDIETAIIQQCTEMILVNRDSLIVISDLVSELDCHLSLARVALDRNYVRPFLSQSRDLHIVGGRHPIHEIVVNTFIVNDTIVNSSDPRLILLTGPNSSGKSVYLKQVALIVYMAHLGSFVPAESASIPMTDKILTRITTRESISKSASAFTIDLKQTLSAVNDSTGCSLVLLDEFGKGTGSYDGVGLFTGVLESFMGRVQSPIVIAATHFHEMIGMICSPEKLGFYTMDIQFDGDGVTFFYNLKKGSAGVSLGTKVAVQAGMDESIVSRARVISDAVSKGSRLDLEFDKGILSQVDLVHDFVAEFVDLNLDCDNDLDTLTLKLDQLSRVFSY